MKEELDWLECREGSESGEVELESWRSDHRSLCWCLQRKIFRYTGQCLLTEVVSDRPSGCQGELELEVGQEEELEELEEEEA